MEGMDKAREMARRIQSGERAAMRRWLTKEDHRPVPLMEKSLAELEDMVNEYTDDLEKIKAEGRKRVVKMLLDGK